MHNKAALRAGCAPGAALLVVIIILSMTTYATYRLTSAPGATQGRSVANLRVDSPTNPISCA